MPLRPPSSRRLALAFLLALSSHLAAAKVEVASLFTDHLVLQRDMPVRVWGTATPGENVAVAFAGQTVTSQADASGNWSARLTALPASTEGRELVVVGTENRVVLRDVLVGEVWLAGGQSNMAFPLSAAANAATAVPAANDPELRLFTVEKRIAVTPQAGAGGKWVPCTPDTAKGFSAVAYFFARELRQTLHVPVGVISSSWGGTPIETWISLEGFRQPTPLAKPLAAWDKALATHQKLEADPTPRQEYAAQLARWRREVEPAFNAATKSYNAAKDAGQPVGARPQPAWPEPENPDPMGMPSPSRRPQTPSISFNAMIAPLAPYALRGALWYQGEANGSAGLEYRTLLPRLIADWRRAWGADFHFLIVQLPCNGHDAKPVAEGGWPWLRDAQALTARDPRTSLAVTIDIGDPNNVHPTDKLDVGHRLALLARRDVYGEKLVATGPRLRDWAIEGDHVRLRFDETGSGLTPGQAPWRARGVEPLPTDRLIGFFVAGSNRAWVPADARIDGASVVVSAAGVPQPVAVRYGWANSPRCNLYNREGLPAAPFRTDDWPK